MSLAFISHPECFLHEMGEGHPEQPARLTAIEDAILACDLKDKIRRVTAPLATREQLLRAHALAHVDNIFNLSPKVGYTIIDPDTAMNSHTLQAALRAAGAAVYGVDLVMKGEISKVFCNVRPPGHHAERGQAMGFCFFNNVAVAAAHALEHHQLERVTIIDFDVHHGNGTEDIFKNEGRVLLCSSFQYPFYPFSGADTTSDHILNLPLPAGTQGREWRKRIEAEWLPALQNFEPQLIFFSAGFDSYIADELADFGLVEEDYAWLTREVLNVAKDSAQGRVVSVLEGGYYIQGLGSCLVAHLRAMIREY